MKTNKRADETQKYGVIQNIVYCLKNVWRWDKAFYLCFVPKIVLSILLPLLVTYFPKLLIDSLTRQVSYESILRLIGIFCTLFVSIDLLMLFTDAKINSMREVFRIKYSNLCEQKYKTTDYENTEDPKVNDLYRQAIDNTGSAENIVNTLSDFCINLLGIVGFGSIIIMLDPFIPLLILVCTIVNYLLSKRIMIYTNKNWRKWAPSTRRINYMWGMTHAYDKIKDIKLYPYESIAISTLDQSHKERLYWHKKIWNLEMLPSVWDIISTLLRNGVAYVILLTRLLNNQMDVGMFVFYFGAVTSFSVWINGISGQFSDIMSMTMRVNFIRSFLEIKDRYTCASSKKTEKDKNSVYDIELKNVSYKYPGSKNTVLKNINLKIEKGEKVALVGHNGAGKTTLVKLICGLYAPKGGDVFLNGENVSEMDIEDYYQLFSVVFQDFHFMPISVAEFVSGDGVDIDRQKVRDCLETAGLYEKVNRCPLGMDTTFYRDIYEDDPGIDFSGGEKQKLLLARALYKDAPILLLDEPTAALDPIAENEMYQQFDMLTKNKTSLYISHRLTSTRFCDRILFMEHGKIVENGSHEELMALKGKYYELFEIQSFYYKNEVGS